MVYFIGIQVYLTNNKLILKLFKKKMFDTLAFAE